MHRLPTCRVVVVLVFINLCVAHARPVTATVHAVGHESAAVSALEAGQAAHARQQQRPGTHAAAGEPAQHTRVLQQYSAAAVDAVLAASFAPVASDVAAAPPADAAAAVAAALDQPMAPAGSAGASTASAAVGHAGTSVPANPPAGQSLSAAHAGNSAAPADVLGPVSGGQLGIQVRRQQQPQQHRRQRQQDSTATEVDVNAPSAYAYDAIEKPEAATAEQVPDQQQRQEQPGQQQQQQEQQPSAPAVSAEEPTAPPNDNSELLPPETTTPAPETSPSPAPTGDTGSVPVVSKPPQKPSEGFDKQPWLNPSLPLSERISSLLRALTLEEKIPMMIHGQAGVPRLGLQPFQFWTECLHGHQERYDGMALPTIFPQPLMLAATFDPQLAFQVFTAISDELRAKSNVEMAKSGIHKFLTCWTPHINLFKDPRWGRGSETFGEDPFLTSAFAENIVHGLQGQEPSITKVVATCKHFLGYGLEGAEGVSRYSHNIELTPQDVIDTDLPPFEACVQAAAGKGIMCSYNAVNGEPACASSTLLQGMLRQGLGFEGYVVSDCNAVAALTFGHKSAGSLAEAAAASVKAGVDMLCDKPDLVKQAVEAGTLTESDLDGALANTLRMRFITGQFDPPAANPWASLPISTVNSREHRQLARQVVHKGTVLLKNDLMTGSSTPMLPLDKGALSKVCITGPLADSAEHMMGNYYGQWDSEAALTPKKAIKDELAKVGVNVSYSRGMDIVGEIHYDWPLESTLEACADADVGLVFVGSSMVELKKNSEGDFKPATEGEGLDRLSLELPGRQSDLIKALARRAPGLPLVVVLMHGGGLDVAWMQTVPAVKAVLSAPFPGQEGGKGLVNLLFGAQSPSGRLPITWYSNSYSAAVSPLDLNMRPDAKSGHPGRSYRFLKDDTHILYPFGYGLSYTTFSYSNLQLLNPGAEGCSNPGELPAVCVLLTVTNTGSTGFKKPAEHVVPLYLTHTALAGIDGNPRHSLRGVARTAPLKPGQSQKVSFSLSRRDFKFARSSDGASMLAPGIWKVSFGVWDAPLVSEFAPVELAPVPPLIGGAHAAPPPVVAAAPGAVVGMQRQQQGGQGVQVWVDETPAAAAAAGAAPSVAAAAPGAMLGQQQQGLQPGGDVVQGVEVGVVKTPAAAAAGPAAAPEPEPATYTGGPVALPTTHGGISQQEAGQRHTADGQFVSREGAADTADFASSSSWQGSAADASSSSSSSRDGVQQRGSVVVDSQRGLAVTVDVPPEPSWT